MINVEALNKITEKLLIPKYGWIEDFEWKVTKYSYYRTYTLKIFGNSNVMSEYVMRTKHKIYREAKDLFRMLGPLDTETFYDVEIIIKEY